MWESERSCSTTTDIPKGLGLHRYPVHDLTELSYLLLNELIVVIANLFIGERFSLGVGE